MTRGYVLDASLISMIRKSRVAPDVYLGSSDIVVPDVAIREAMRDLPRGDPKRVGNALVLAQIREVSTAGAIKSRALALEATYAIHHPPLAENDAAIIAVALATDRIVVTANPRDFHAIAGLHWINAHGFRYARSALIKVLPLSPSGPSSKPCCQRLRRSMGIADPPRVRTR